MRYKVVELNVKDVKAPGQMEPKQFDAMLHAHAADGWEPRGFIGNRDVILAVLKKTTH